MEKVDNRKIVITRGSKLDKKELLRSALRSTDNDIFVHGERVIVCGRNDAGELVELGSIDYSSAWLVSANTSELVDFVRFSAILGK